MVDYKNAKIYALRSHQTDKKYIGKTCEKLSVRMGKHKSDWKHRETRKYYTAFEILKYDDCYIELIKECSCENVEQLNKIEGECIRENDCVNKRIENRTKKEWREDNKEYLTQYKKDRKEHYKKLNDEWRKNNQDKIKQYKKVKTTCDICNEPMLRSSLTKHKKRKHDF
tara:strand:- start:1572 stop:2078 length:507 start_codon:yes stop_codon:yes gene_type:complete